MNKLSSLYELKEELVYVYSVLGEEKMNLLFVLLQIELTGAETYAASLIKKLKH